MDEIEYTDTCAYCDLPIWQDQYGVWLSSEWAFSCRCKKRWPEGIVTKSGQYMEIIPAHRPL